MLRLHFSHMRVYLRDYRERCKNSRISHFYFLSSKIIIRNKTKQVLKSVSDKCSYEAKHFIRFDGIWRNFFWSFEKLEKSIKLTPVKIFNLFEKQRSLSLGILFSLILIFEFFEILTQKCSGKKQQGCFMSVQLDFVSLIWYAKTILEVNYFSKNCHVTHKISKLGSFSLQKFTVRCQIFQDFDLNSIRKLRENSVPFFQSTIYEYSRTRGVVRVFLLRGQAK